MNLTHNISLIATGILREIGAEEYHKKGFTLVCKAFASVINYETECKRLGIVDHDCPKNIDFKDLFFRSVISKNGRAKALSLALSGKNVLLTGGAGTGKTHSLKEIMEKVKDNAHKNKNFGMIGNTATTAAASILISTKKLPAVTIHSYLGLGAKFYREGKPNQSAKEYAMEKYANSFAQYNIPNHKLKMISILRIDEIFMMSKRTFEYFSEFLKLVRKNHKPFGGIQLICSGDPYQFSPVPEKTLTGEEILGSREFCYESEEFDIAFPNNQIITLLHSYRQKNDLNFFYTLERAKNGYLTQFDVQFLNTRIFKEEDVPNDVMWVYPTNKQVKKKNDEYLDSLTGKMFAFESELVLKDDFYNEIEMPRSVKEKYKKVLYLKLGCKVVVLKNIDQNEGVVNGTFCTIKSFTLDGYPVLGLPSGKEYPLEPYKTTQRIQEGNLIVTEIPLDLAGAITIHKMQGRTVESIAGDLGSAAFDAAVYTLLSRVTTSQGLYLINFIPEKVKRDSSVIKFSEKTNPMTRKTEKIRRFPTKEQLSEKINEFLSQFKIQENKKAKIENE